MSQGYHANNCALIKFIAVGALLAGMASLGATDEPETDSPAPEQAFDLGVMEISADLWTYDQEVFLRMIRQAYGKPRSDLEEDRDELVCWLSTNRNTRQSRLKCARNGDLQARKRLWGYDDDPLFEAGYGMVFTSLQAITEPRLEKLLSTIPGGDDFNDEFLALIAAGERPPRRIPSDTDLQRYAAATKELEEHDPGTLDESERMEIIGKQGFSVPGYDRIRDIVDMYPSVRAQLPGK